jgi:hypothetical protein
MTAIPFSRVCLAIREAMRSFTVHGVNLPKANILHLPPTWAFLAPGRLTRCIPVTFLWNFVGRTNDLDGQTSNSGADGNWISGWNFNKPLPAEVTQSKSYNRLFFLPLIIGLVGLFFHFKNDQRNAGVVLVLFFFTGLAIVLYLNQDPLQPRERDYAYAGSFYAFAIWIGLGVMGIAELLRKVVNAKTSGIIATVACLLAAPY